MRTSIKPWTRSIAGFGKTNAGFLLLNPSCWKFWPWSALYFETGEGMDKQSSAHRGISLRFKNRVLHFQKAMLNGTAKKYQRARGRQKPKHS